MKRILIILRVIASVLFIMAGINHFCQPEFYVRIVPPELPWPMTLVFVSGIAEVVGGASLLVPSLRYSAGCGLIALLIAVFPANIYMAVASERFTDLHIPLWVLWVRLPLQVVFIFWVWLIALLPAKSQ